MNASDIRSIEIEVSDYCNLKCPLCSRSFLNDEQKKSINKNHLELEVIKNLFSQLECNVEVTLSGVFGDPLAHPQILNICDFLCDHTRSTVTIATNGSLGSAETFAGLGELSRTHKNLWIEFSIDGLSGVNEVYRINAKFEKILENVKAFIGAGGLAICKMIVFAHNEHQVDDVSSFAKSMNFKKIKRVYTTRFTEGDRDKDLRPARRVKEVQAQLKGDPVDFEEEINCRFQNKASIYLSTDGRIYPCCFLAADAKTSSYWPSLEKSMVELNGEEYNSIKSKTLDEILSQSLFAEYVSKGWSQVLETTKTCYTHCSVGRLEQKAQLVERVKVVDES